MNQNFIEFPLESIDTLFDKLKSSLKQAKTKTNQLLNVKNKTYKNFIQKSEELSYQIHLVFTPIVHLNSVCNTQKTQKIAVQSELLYTEYSTDFWHNISIFDAYKEVFEKEKSKLNEEQITVLEKTIKSFQSSGCSLPDVQKDKLKKINLRLSELSNQFSENLLKATNAYSLVISNEEDVQELPEIDKKMAEFVESGVTKWKFSLQIPSYMAYMTYGNNRDLRKKLEIAYTSRSPENEPIIEEILNLRAQKSKLLNFQNFAELSLDQKMAPSPDAVLDFQTVLADKTKKIAKTEWKELQNFAKKKDLKGELSTFDRSYYSQWMKKELYSFDENAYREYFEKNSVLKGLFVFLKQMFGLSTKKVKAQIWDPKVLVYEFSKNRKTIGRIYFDLEARKDKRSGAWMHNWQTHHLNMQNQPKMGVSFIVCNFPSSKPKLPSLLKHSDVVTLFHEMGHALHHICSDVKEVNVSGVNGVEWDAVEFPSQFLENFAYCPEVLELFAKHYQSKKTLSNDMIQKLINVRNFQSALAIVRQLEFGIFDMKIHLGEYDQKQVQEILDNVRKMLSPFKTPKYNKFQNGFSHIFDGGYAAGYYSYKWAEVLSADAYYRFLDKGIFDPETADKFYQIILTRGGSISPMKLFQEFMDREPDPSALLRLYGIK